MGGRPAQVNRNVKDAETAKQLIRINNSTDQYFSPIIKKLPFAGQGTPGDPQELHQQRGDLQIFGPARHDDSSRFAPDNHRDERLLEYWHELPLPMPMGELHLGIEAVKVLPYRLYIQVQIAS